MTTDNPEVKRWPMWRAVEELAEAEWVVRDNDHDETVKALQADYQRLQADHERLQAECDQLRAAIRRLCNIYVVDDYYMGQLREDRLDMVVNRAIDGVKETTK